MKYFLLVILAASASAQPVPYYSRSQTTNQDAGAGNANLRDITGRKRDNLVNAVGNATCQSGEALLGSAQKDGYLFGGGCSAVPTLAGNNAFTGNNTFTGQVHASSGASVNFAPGAYTTPQASFIASVTGSTISFTVQGTTVACWTAGTIGSNGNSFLQVGIRVDGSVSAIPGTSATVGVLSQNNQGSGSCVNIGNYVEFQVTGGGASHTFSLGFWSPAPNTETWPCNSTGASIGQFGCREVLSR